MKYLTTIIICVLMLFPFQPYQSFAAETNDWVNVAVLPSTRTGAAVAEVNGIIYVIGGTGSGNQAVSGTKTNTVFAYDSRSDTWTTKTNMPTVRAGVTAAVYGEKIYVVGGYYDRSGNTYRTDKVEVYDTVADTWETVASLPAARSWSAATVLDGMIYVVGGGNSSKIVATVERYDISKNKWTTMKNFPVALTAMNLVSVDGKMYAFAGGMDYETTMTRAIYEYDASRDSWMKKNDFKTATSSSAAVVHNGEIYILGGFIKKNAWTSRVEVYNPEKNEVRAFQELTFARYQSVAATVNGELFIIGGTDGKVTLSTVQKYSLVREDPTNPEQPTPEQPSGNRAILVITMTTGLEKEFDLSMQEVNDFITWYEAKQAGSGKASYAINKHDNNKGPFSSRKDYILYDRVLTFEVSEY